MGGDRTSIKIPPGTRFGLLTVIERAPVRPKGPALWRCQCDCGNTTEVRSLNLRHGRTKSCGCMSAIGRVSAPKPLTQAQKVWRARREYFKSRTTKGASTEAIEYSELAEFDKMEG